MLFNSILQRWRVSVRLLALCLLAILMLAIMGALSLFDLRQSMLEERQSKVRAQVESAVGVVNYFQNLADRGQLSKEDAQAQAAAALRDVRFEKNEYFFIINTDMVYQMHPIKPELVGKYKGDLRDPNGVMILQDLVAAAKKGGDFSYFHFAKPGAKEPQPKIAYSMLVPAWNWVIATGVYEDDLNAAFIHKLIFASIQLFGLALLLGWVSWIIARSILQQLGGEPRDAMQIMSEVTAGNLQVQINCQHPNSLLASLAMMVQGLRSTLQSVQQHADTLSKQSSQIAQSSNAISQAATKQADATCSMAAAMEELTVSISHISDNSNITEHSSRDATELARTGVSQVRDTTELMEHIARSVSGATLQIQELDGKAKAISGIAAVIKDIAGQTNLLALNAAIEAARAGEQGRGFAVVADEVRKLAERTSTATIDIERMLIAILGETEQVVIVMQAALPEVNRGVELARYVADSLQHIHQGAQSTLEHLQEVASATREQSVASNSIAVRVEDISQMVEETSIAIRHSAENARGVEQIAAELKTMVGRFRI
ncbi:MULTISPECIES: methyl-accepting chemotaxis protein [Deefgea]|uniref:Methyl-accepting chemotaxis protein n=1 Tax=Deefgea chitinilytica TaxID=570276 RepID=A0ABS2CEF9_9NEIS|nr:MULTISPECIES: methyl-accepting chemotaxis protein [Deefgea]MBM5572538.1 methyl-accepting chemotaxis protein [Deefgea chitinilytica]MBM9889774.1 cache domain-containing protein [Deefgea sp. CFH1-16]